MQHVLSLVSMVKPKCWGSWHQPLNNLVSVAHGDAHQDDTVPCTWFWQRSDMVELCEVWVSMRKCTAVLPITHSNGHGQPSCSWMTKQHISSSITNQAITGIALPYLFLLWSAWWCVLQMPWCSSMLPQSERKANTTSAMKVHLGACTCRFSPKAISQIPGPLQFWTTGWLFQH